MIEPKRPDREEPAAAHILRVERVSVHLRHLYISRAATLAGHSGRTPGEEVVCLYCISGRGIIGDRFFDHSNDGKGQITFFSQDVYKKMCRAVRVHTQAAALRCNVFIEGVDLNQLIGRQFAIRGIQFEGTEVCQPGHWMDEAIAPGAEEFLKGNGGLRARILNDGWLRAGAADLFVYEPGYQAR